MYASSFMRLITSASAHFTSTVNQRLSMDMCNSSSFKMSEPKYNTMYTYTIGKTYHKLSAGVSLRSSFVGRKCQHAGNYLYKDNLWNVIDHYVLHVIDFGYI